PRQPPRPQLRGTIQQNPKALPMPAPNRQPPQVEQYNAIARRSGLVAAPIIVRCLWFPIGSRGKQVVAVRVLETRIAVNVIILPRIFWQSLIQLIPARWPRIGIWLGHKRLQTLFGRRIKTVHAFIKLKLGVDSLEVSGNSNMPRIFHVAR